MEGAEIDPYICYIRNAFQSTVKHQRLSCVHLHRGCRAHESASFTYSRKNDGVKERDDLIHIPAAESLNYIIYPAAVVTRYNQQNGSCQG
jgi:hypothetical protein